MFGSRCLLFVVRCLRLVCLLGCCSLVVVSWLLVVFVVRCLVFVVGRFLVLVVGCLLLVVAC